MYVATGFLTTDQTAWLWFVVSNVSVEDDYSVAFYTPAGTNRTAASGDFGYEYTPGTYCCAVGMYIAGYTPATLPGTWNAYIYNNGSQIYRQPFTIAGSTTCSYSLSSNPASIAAAGGSSSFTVTTGAGCTASASSDVTWITPTVSGSTVSYTVQANTSTSSRIGHIAVNGQTCTVTQAGAGGGGTTTSNLIQNGDAESGPGGTDAAQPAIPSWNTDGQIAVTT